MPYEYDSPTEHDALAAQPVATEPKINYLVLEDEAGASTGIEIILGEGEDFTDEEDPKGILKAASRIKDWRNYVLHGEETPYSEAAARAALCRYQHWVDQILKAA